jgi:hypothetical protein
VRIQQNPAAQMPFGQPPLGLMSSVGPPPPPPPLPPPIHIDPQQINALQTKINTITEQLQQSEKNLKAQEDFLGSKKKVA